MKPCVRILSAVLGLLVVHLQAADPFVFHAPREWRSERIPFPLGFAPELRYQGFEELRFAPGMFEPKSDTFWTYTFFWWLKGDQAVTRKTLERDLLDYYRGLSRNVGGSRGFTIDPAKIAVEIRSVESDSKTAAGHPPSFRGTLTTYDAFVTGRLIRLHFEASHQRFQSADRTWVFLALSPASPEAPPKTAVWQTLRRIRDSFQVR